MNRAEQKQFDLEVKELALEETEGVMEIVTTWMKEGIRKGRQEGRREGIEEGELKALSDSVVEILEARFGRIPAAVKKKLKAIENRKQLKLLLREAATATNLPEFERAWAGLARKPSAAQNRGDN